ncbi:MAG TPA: hypothetical protein VIL74_00270 [Pyrinomonadaceae bacterium]|jgi:hypothetical protein
MSESSFEDYRKSYQALSFISKLAAFLLALLAALNLCEIARFFYLQNYGLEKLFEIHLLFPATVLQLLILAVFALKFASLFFESKKAFKFGQILRLFGLFLLLLYFIVSIPSLAASGIYETAPAPIFRHASRSFSVAATAYLTFSPLRQIVTLILSSIKFG